jgi:microcystin-dependent protein
MPIGSVIMFAGESIPTGWLVCDGSLLTSDNYPDLYTVIGVKYGGSGANFNLPNFKGRVAAGADSNDIDFNLLGKTGGEKTHILTINEIPSHTHRTENICSYPEGVPNTHTGYGYNEISLNKSSYGSDIGATGGGQAHNNLQPYLVINYIIKATNTTPLAGSVVNAQSSSTTDAYSCKYINDNTANNEQITNKVTEITP